MRRKQRAIKEFDFSDYDFSDCVEITGDALYLINGGAEIENSVEAQANANVGDTVTNSKGETHTLTEGDINWAKDQISNGGNQATACAGETPETNPTANADTSQKTNSTGGSDNGSTGGSDHKDSSRDTYTVRPKDTMSQIVYDHNKQYGTNLTVEHVAKINGIKDPNKIRPGQQINFGSCQTSETQKSTSDITGDSEVMKRKLCRDEQSLSPRIPNAQNISSQKISAGDEAATPLPSQDNNENTVTTDNLNSVPKGETIIKEFGNSFKNLAINSFNSVKESSSLAGLSSDIVKESAKIYGKSDLTILTTMSPLSRLSKNFSVLGNAFMCIDVVNCYKEEMQKVSEGKQSKIHGYYNAITHGISVGAGSTFGSAVTLGATAATSGLGSVPGLALGIVGGESAYELSECFFDSIESQLWKE